MDFRPLRKIQIFFQVQHHSLVPVIFNLFNDHEKHNLNKKLPTNLLQVQNYSSSLNVAENIQNIHHNPSYLGCSDVSS